MAHNANCPSAHLRTHGSSEPVALTWCGIRCLGLHACLAGRRGQLASRRGRPVVYSCARVLLLVLANATVATLFFFFDPAFALQLPVPVAPLRALSSEYQIRARFIENVPLRRLVPLASAIQSAVLGSWCAMRRRGTGGDVADQRAASRSRGPHICDVVRSVRSVGCLLASCHSSRLPLPTAVPHRGSTTLRLRCHAVRLRI